MYSKDNGPNFQIGIIAGHGRVLAARKLALRSLEDMSTVETAKCLDVTEETVRVRLSRARRMLRRGLYERARAASVGAFEFLGERCDRITANVLARIIR